MTFAGEGSRAQSNGLRRSVTLDALQAIYAIGTGPGGVSLARLPHGECGAWGRAPRWSNFRITHGTALIFRDQQTIKNRDRAQQRPPLLPLVRRVSIHAPTGGATSPCCCG